MPSKRDYRGIDKLALWESFGGLCGICSKPIAFEDITIDHIIPLKRRGTNKVSNLQPAHHQCNQDKGDLMPWEEPKPKKHKKLGYRNWPCYNR